GAADRERKDAAIGKTDLERLAAAAHRRLLDHDRREPMHVIEWKPRALERLPPSRRIRRLALGFDTTDRLREVCFGTLELRAARIELVKRKPVLQRRLDCPLQRGIDGRAHRV